METALLNLAINARDVMPNGGRLILSRRHRQDAIAVAGLTDIAVGEDARLAVSDSGTRMTHEVLDAAFEPFFTTKPIGKGVGLDSAKHMALCDALAWPHHAAQHIG